jgi:hypothetical protein
MNDRPPSPTSSQGRAGSFWAALAVLGVVVQALVSALYFVQTRALELRAAHAASQSAPLVMTPLPAVSALEPPAGRDTNRQQPMAKQRRQAQHQP